MHNPQKWVPVLRKDYAKNMRKTFARSAALLLVSALPAQAEITLKTTAQIDVVFDAHRDRCDGHDTPDMNPRAYRDSSGKIHLFALHFFNRALRGPSLDKLKIDCKIALGSGLNANPAIYDDRRYLTATWTDDGTHINAVVHHEYHAENHGTCTSKETLACWYNSYLSFRSKDGGISFQPDTPIVLAAAPFKQTQDQGRHRGFFNPSNIVSDGAYKYFLGATTGWAGQNFGPCLFRSADPKDSSSWRAWDGKDFTVHYADPYGPNFVSPKACAPLAPFGMPVGSISRHTKSGTWIAVWQAPKNTTTTPVEGFYYTTSKTLTQWSAPKLLRAGKTMFSDPCTSGGALINYPALLDADAKTRNFEDVTDTPSLFYTVLKVEGCKIGTDRTLVREKVTITDHK